MKAGRMSSTSPGQEQVRPSSGRALPPADAARYLGVVTEKTLANWRSLGMGPPFVRVGEGKLARVAYRLGDLNAWLDAHRVPPGEAAGETVTAGSDDAA